MARVTEAQVRAIKEIPAGVAVDPHIDCATLIVDDINSKCNKNFDETRLTCIELYLSAYFVGSNAPSVKSEKFENAQNTYQVGAQSLEGIMSDKYGQIANMMSEGCLQMLDKQPATFDLL